MVFGMKACTQCGRVAYTSPQLGWCLPCLQKQAAEDELARVEILRQHPDLEELDNDLDEWYS